MIKRSSTSSFLPRTAWWRWLHGAAAPALPEMSPPNGPFVCCSQTLRLWAGSVPRLDPRGEAQARRWAEWGSGHSPRSARRPGSGEMEDWAGWSWRMRSWRKNWRAGKWSCRTEELLLWLWSDWGRWRELQPNACSSPRSKVGIVGTVTITCILMLCFFHIDDSKIQVYLEEHSALLLTVMTSNDIFVSLCDELTFRDTLCETEKYIW